MIKFELLEKYKAEEQKRLEVRSQFQQREEAAKCKYEELKQEYSAVIQRSVIEGVDLTDELDKLDAEISEAKKAYERRQRETAVGSTMGTKTIKHMDVINEFNANYKRQVQEAVLPSIYERVEKGRAMILSAILDLYETKDEYDYLVEELKPISEAARNQGETPYYHSISNPVLKNIDFSGRPEIANMISELPYEANAVLEKRELPAKVEYIKTVKGGK